MKGTICEKWINSFSPTCNENFQINKRIAVVCQVLFNGVTSYEIQEADDAHTLDLDKNTCTCRERDIYGIPCQHAICALVHNKQESMDQISSFYHIDMYRVSYQFKIMP